jgi:glycosyl transferase family 11/glycosyl transferase family 7 (putative galactosyltransferase)
MMTYSMLGHPRRGRLGNQLFQIASTIGLANHHGHDPVFPLWKYREYFNGPFLMPAGQFQAWKRAELHFHHDPDGFGPGPEQGGRADDHYDVDGWRQSLRYWEHCEPLVRETFAFREGFLQAVRAKFEAALRRPAIAISVRRGDFVGNPNYAQLPASYYYLALFKRFPDWRDHNVILFSDDLPYCRVHFEGLPNVHFAEGTDVEQLCLMAQCRHFIVSNSTFSWWGAYLGEKEGTRVVRPNYLFDGDLKRRNSDRDYWPAQWEVFDHAGQKLDLSDVTFTVPVFIDHAHRRQNVGLSVCMLHRDLDTHVILGEQGSKQLGPMAGARTMYHWFGGLKVFHRTYMLNHMAGMAQTPYIVNWDCDVFVPPVQLWLAAERLRAGEDMVYPYDGRFARVPRTWFKPLEAALDLGIFRDTQFTGKHGRPVPTTSVGGAIMFNRESFFNGGGENEHMVSFGPEDWERNHRFKALGYAVTRVDGSLYHLDHFCGPDSSARNPYFKRNHAELDKLRAMSPEELDAYVCSWPWR